MEEQLRRSSVEFRVCDHDPRRFGDGEERSRGNCRDGCTDKEKTDGGQSASQVQVGRSSSSGSAAARADRAESGGQLRVQGVSLDADKRELQRLARDSVEYYFKDKQVKASDSLIDEVGALLTESG